MESESDEWDPEKEERLRQKALAEIISSEKSYLRHIDVLLQYFKKPIQEDRLLPRNLQVGIFGDIESMYRVNKILLDKLEESPDNVGEAFIELGPYFKLYSTYASNFEQSTILLQEAEKKHRSFVTFRYNQEIRPEVSMKLNSLLIMPIQRVPRYCLLLDELLKHTPVNHHDRNLIKKALVEVRLVANHINEKIREHENVQKMLSIQKSLHNGQPRIIIPGRRFIKEGVLKKVSHTGGNAHDRYFFLFNDMLIYCRARVCDLASLTCSCILPIKYCQVEKLLGGIGTSATVFKITCQSECLVLYSHCPEEAQGWIDAIQQACNEFQLGRQTLRKVSDSRPMRRDTIRRLRKDSFDTLFKSRKRKMNTLDEVETGTPVFSPKDSLYPMRAQLHECLSPNKKLKQIQEEINSEMSKTPMSKCIIANPHASQLATPGQNLLEEPRVLRLEDSDIEDGERCDLPQGGPDWRSLFLGSCVASIPKDDDEATRVARVTEQPTTATVKEDKNKQHYLCHIL